MVTKNLQLDIVLNKEMYVQIEKIAQKEGMSLSLMACALLKESLEHYEDNFWQKEAKKREKSF